MGMARHIRAAIGAGATVANALAGDPIEYQPEPGVVSIYGNGDIAGMSIALSANYGKRGVTLIPPGSSLGVGSTVGNVKSNEDFIGQFPVDAGARLVLSVTNPGAASNYSFKIQVD